MHTNSQAYASVQAYALHTGAGPGTHADGLRDAPVARIH
jgi:hypothetical protein